MSNQPSDFSTAPVSQLSRAFYHTEEALMLTDSEGHIEFINPAFEKLTGFLLNEVKGQTPSILKSGFHTEKFYSEMWQTIKAGQPFSKTMLNKRKNGDVYYDDKRITPIPDEQGNITHFLSTSRDVTDFVKAKEEAEMLARFAELNPAPVLRFDNSDSIRQCNPAAKKILGDNTDRKLSEIIPELSVAKQHFCIEKGEIIHIEAKIYNQYYRFTVKGFPEYKYGQIYGSEITELVEARNKLKRALKKAEAATKAKSLFLSSMNHELRTPVNGILGMVEMLRRTDLNTDQKQFVHILNNSTKALSYIVNTNLDHARIEAGHIEIVNIPANIKDTIQKVIDIQSFAASEKGLALSFNYEIEHVITDPYRLTQVLLNLVNNAIKFTDEGRVHIEARQIHAEQAEDESFCIEFTVKDTGTGIPENRLTAIFEEYQQAEALTDRKYGGTGLGLSICSKIINAMGGSIYARNNDGPGSSFIFTIPVQKACKPVTNNPDEARQSQPRTLKPCDKKFLIVEDDPINQKVLKAMLAHIGCIPDIAADATEARLLLNKKTYDIVFMDLYLPGEDGIELTRSIRSQPEIKQPCIIGTTGGSKAEQNQCLVAGMDHIIAKPVSLESIQQKLQEIFSFQEDQI